MVAVVTAERSEGAAGPGGVRLGCAQMPSWPRGSVCMSDGVCGGPGGDWAGVEGGAPEAWLWAEMALGIGLGLLVCPSEPVIHALGRGANQLSRGTMPWRQMGVGELPGAEASGHCVCCKLSPSPALSQPGPNAFSFLETKMRRTVGAVLVQGPQRLAPGTALPPH